MPFKLIKSLASRIAQGDQKPDRAGSKAGKSSKAKSTRGQDAAKPNRDIVLPGGQEEVWRPGKKTAGKADQSNPQRKSRRPSGKGGGSRSTKNDSAAGKGKAPQSQGNRNSAKRPNRSKAGGKRGQGRAARQSDSKRAATQVKPAPAGNWSLSDYQVPPQEGKTRFHDVALPDSVMHGVADMGFQYCTPVQARVLTEVAQGHNVAGKAQTGTGKTAAFLLLIFKQFLEKPAPTDRPLGQPRALVLAPTRELVIQIVRDAEAIGKYCGLRHVAIYGGTDYDRQERDLLSAPVDLIAATPGRLLDFARKRKIDLRHIDVLVIDEADRMLDMGFIPDVRSIIRQTPPKDRRRTLLFSATLSDDVMRLASQWMPNPHVVEIEPEQVAVDTVKQLVYLVRTEEKFKVLYNILRLKSTDRSLIFANRRDQADRIAFELKRYGIECALLSGAVDQKKRMRVLDQFRAGEVMTVVATDVAGRGLHVDGIDHVINFDLPYEAEDYVHRIGRTGRAGAEGTAVSFACEDESFGIPAIEEYIGESMSCKYPEDVLLRALPHTDAPTYRSKRSRDSSSRGGPRRSGGGGRSSSRGRRPPRRR